MKNDWINMVFPASGGEFPAGSLLECQYQITHPDLEKLQVVETSVMWLTTGKGNEDIGVHFFKRSTRKDMGINDLSRTHRFQTILPPSPLSYDGEILQIRWCVRVKLFFSGGRQLSADLPFTMRPAPKLRHDSAGQKNVGSSTAKSAGEFDSPRRKSGTGESAKHRYGKQ